MAEVEAMEAKISTLQAQFEKSRNDEEKQDIELERKRQEALLAAQKLQAENLAAEADRRAADAARAETEAKQRALDSANASARQNELAKLAAKRREELAKLSKDAESEDPDVLIATFQLGKRSAAKSLFGTVNISSRDRDGEIYIDNKWMGTAPLTLTILEGDYKIESRWADGDIGGVSVTLKAGRREIASITKPPKGFIYVEGGTFRMGSTSGSSDEKPVHSVTLSSFLISLYEVTQKEYRILMGSNPSSPGDNYPVNNASWNDAIEYCNKLSQKEGLLPVYSGYGDNIFMNINANGYRLPTEA